MNAYTAREIIRECLEQKKLTMDQYVEEQSRWLQKRFGATALEIIACLNQCDIAVATDLCEKPPAPEQARSDGDAIRKMRAFEIEIR